MDSAVKIRGVSPDKAAGIVERHLEAKSKWDLICLGIGTGVFLIYITPIAGVLQAGWRAITKVPAATEQVADAADGWWDVLWRYWVPDLKMSPKVDHRIAGHIVTSAFGKRTPPCKGCSDQHRGVDIGTPAGTALHAIGKPGQKVTVKCWSDKNGGGNVIEFESFGFKFKYLHTSECRGGIAEAGKEIGRSGNTGTSTNPHLHFQQEEKKNGEWVAVPPMTGFVWASLEGHLPAPLNNGDAKPPAEANTEEH